MQRKQFLRQSMLAAPAMLMGSNIMAIPGISSPVAPFVVDDGKSRFGDVIKFLGVHPNDLKISSSDTNGQLSVFEYTGLSKAGPPLHLHFEQDEIFTILDGEYRFVCGAATFIVKSGQTIFLPRNIAHTWLQLSEKGKIIYMLQPAGKMEEFFAAMNNLKAPPSANEIDEIHQAHGMKVVGPPLTL